MTIRIEDFPANMQQHAKRNERFAGRGTAEVPYVGGWVVDGRAASYDDEAKSWLKANGFTYYGRRWLRADDVGSE